MANFTAGTSFSNGVTNDVTALKLNALVADAVPTSNLALTSTNGTIANFTSSTANITLGTIPTLTAGTTTGTAGIFTSGTIATLNSTTGTIPTLVATTLVTTGTGTAAAPAIVPTGDTNTGIFFPAAATIAATTNGTERLRIDSSGNVGIGTTSPASLFHLNAPATGGGAIFGNQTYNYATVSQINSSADAVFGGGVIASNVASEVKKITADVAHYMKMQIGEGITFHTNITGASGTSVTRTTNERMRIDSSGNVIIGTSTAWGAGKTTIESSDLPLGLRAGSNNAALVIGKATNNSTTSQVLLQFLHNSYSDGIGQINANGANSAAFGSYSDSRLKENITELPSQLANICLLKPSEFDYKNGSGHQVGFIAQEIQQIYPDVVGEGDGGMLTVTGWSKTEARLVKAIQELKAENDSLKSRIEALEAK